MSGPGDPEMAAVVEAPAYAGFLPYLEYELDLMAKAIETRANNLSMKGELTPDLAQQYWIEKSVLGRVLKHFQQRVSVKSAIATQAAAHFGDRAKTFGEY